MDATATYKYVLYPGNNPTVIQQALTKRKVWSQVSQQKILFANLIWKPLNFAASLYEQINQIMRYDKNKNVLLNHFENNVMICTKSGLVRSLKHYYSHDNMIYQQNYHVFETIPTTFIVNPNKESSEYKAFLDRFTELEDKNYSKEKIPSKHCQKNIWYIKPEASNQGRGITVTNSFKEIESIVFAKSTNSSYILQKAIEKPLLYHGRKFDVRAWALVTSNFEIYFYKAPYIRTSSYEYDDSAFDGHIHLTNNCQQKHFSQYSKFEDGNTIPFSCLKDMLIQMGKTDATQLYAKILQRMRSLVVDSFLSVRKFFLRNVKKKEFELFGFDFLIDEDLRTWLLQVNNNPYLGVPNKFIKQILPEMINEMFEIVLDPLFPPVDYQPVETRNYELLHKEVTFYRINPIRSGSTDNKRKDYYPMEQFSMTSNREIALLGNKSRRNSEAVNIGCFQNTEKTMKIRYSTPAESIKYLLDTYCFSDLQPFIVPVNFLLSSPRLEDAELLELNLKNVKLVTESRISHVLLEPKFVLLSKKLLQSENINGQIKSCILNGYTNSIRNYKNKQSVIKSIVPTLKQVLKCQKKDDASQHQKKLAQSVILLLIRLGGNVNRKIFIPGQSRQKQISREQFITSGTYKLLIGYKECYSGLCCKEYDELMANFNERDWELCNSTEKGEQNCNFQKYDNESTNKKQGLHEQKANSKQAHSISRSFAKMNNTTIFPRIKR